MKTKLHTLNLPFPPSVNGYWMSRVVMKGGKPIVFMAINKKGKDFRKEVIELCKDCVPMTSRLKLEIALYPPTKRSFDIDNRIKPLLDAMEHAEVFENDSQIDELHVYRRDVEKGGRVMVQITEI